MKAFQAFIVSMILALALGMLSSKYFIPFTPEGLPSIQAETAKEYWFRGSFVPELYTNLDAELRAESKEGKKIVQDVYSLTKYGTLTPKQGFMMPFIASFFFGFFGATGFLILNALLAGLIVYFTFKLAEEFSGVSPGSRLFILVILGTQLITHFTHLSYDLLGLVFFLGGFSLSKEKGLLGSFIAALSIFVRPSYLLLIPVVILVRVVNQRSRGDLVVLGSLLGCTAYALLNWVILGDALATTYQRIPMYVNGSLVIQDHPVGFDLSIFTSNIWDKFFDMKVGACLFNLSLLLVPFAFLKAKKRDASLLILLYGGLINFLYVFSYPMWDESFRGNRFLLPTVFLWLIASYCLFFSAKDSKSA